MRRRWLASHLRALEEARRPRRFTLVPAAGVTTCVLSELAGSCGLPGCPCGGGPSEHA